MLPTQNELILSPHIELYDKIIPKDNLLKQINELVDFSFILTELKTKYCLDNGRMAIPPIRMFKYLLLKSIYKLSDVDVVERSRFDLSFKYFLDMAPEDDVINPSSLTKFRRQRLNDEGLSDLLISKTLEIAIEKDIIQSSSIIVDSTHTNSRYDKTAIEFLIEQSKVISNEHTNQMAFQETKLFLEKSKERYKIEAKNNELKNRHGYKKAISSGLFGMHIQGATTIFAVNLKRIIKHMSEN